MHGEYVTDVAIGNEIGNLSIAVARDVLQCCVASRPLIEALYGHNGEQLIDGPTVGKALEEREITKVLVG